MTKTHSAACFCGAVAIEATGEPLEMGYCHCRSCRTYSGAPVVGYVLWHADDIRIVRGEALLETFSKTQMSHRRFCRICGGHLVTDHPDMGLTDIRAAAFADLVFEPTVHLNYGEAVLAIKDGLPKLKDFPAHVGGSGETLSE